MTRQKTSHDLIVLGGGRAADLAIDAGKAGWNVVLIERDRLGGTCPNRGCVPSKLLIGFSDHARAVREAGKHFIDAPIRGVDLAKIFQSVNDYIGGVDGRYEKRLRDANVTLVRGEGRFSGPKEISVEGQTFAADTIVIATGSRPKPPPFPELPVWTSDNLFPFVGKPPESILIIGGGAIGCEMASFFAGVGVKTRLLAKGTRLLGKEDADIETVFQKEFSRDVEVHLESELTDLTHLDGLFHATFQTPDGKRTFQADRILFAIGRVPNSDSLDLAKTGMEVDEKGFITVNEHLETCVPGIYATGDVNGRHMLLHAAAREVFYLREKLIKGKGGPIREEPLGHAIYAHPEVASVGKTEDELKEEGIPHVAVFTDWLASARVEAMRIEYPRTKLIVSPEDHSILGCHLVGPEASTLIHQVIAVMKLKNDVRELADIIHIHPALNECLLEAAVKAIRAVREWKK